MTCFAHGITQGFLVIRHYNSPQMYCTMPVLYCLLEGRIIHAPLSVCIRKGKERFVCDERLARRLVAVEDKKKNAGQLAALRSLLLHYDLDSVAGLSDFDRRQVQTFAAPAPFDYEKNCLLFLPPEQSKAQMGSEKEIQYLARQICQLVNATCGHTLILFTSYSLMGAVYRLVRDKLPFESIKVWQHSQDAIHRFKEAHNAVLFAAGSCWEGIDFPGDVVSSLIIPRLPFPVPDSLSEAEQKRYFSLQDYIQAVVIPGMQVKLRQGFGRAIRTETDTCVVSILDDRAAPTPGEDITERHWKRFPQ